MSTEKHRAIVRISYQFMRDILFPEGTEILAIVEDVQDIFGRQDFVCVVENPELPITKEGDNLLTITPSYIRHFIGVEGEIPTVIFDQWEQ